MKKKSLILFLLAISIMGYAQVGIKTLDPKGIFHVDGMGDNGSVTNPTQIDNDFIVTDDGNVGIGTLTPRARLDLQGIGNGTTTSIYGLRLDDGNQGEGKMVASDADGFGKWQDVPGTWFGTLSANYSPALETSYDGISTDYIYLRNIDLNLSKVSSEINNARVEPLSGGVSRLIVPYGGYYRITISGEWSRKNNNGPFLITVHLRDHASFSLLYQGSALGYCSTQDNWRSSTQWMSIIYLNKNAPLIVSTVNNDPSKKTADQVHRFTLIAEYLGQ